MTHACEAGYATVFIYRSAQQSRTRRDAVHEIGHALGLVNLAPASVPAATWHD